MKQQVNYCIVLSAEQLDYLAGSKYGIDRMKILHQLIMTAVLKETVYSIKGFTATLKTGQAVLSEVDLSNRLHYDKKTISRVLDKMNRLGIVTTEQNNRTSVHTLKCVSAWSVDGQRIDNPFYVPLKDRQASGCSQKTVCSEDYASPATYPSANVPLPVFSADGVLLRVEASAPVSPQLLAGEESQTAVSTE